KCIRISSFLSAQPDDSRHDRVAPGRVHWNYFASPAPIFENRSSRSAVADFVRDLQLTQRRTVTSGAIAQSEFGSRNRIGGDEVAFLEKRKLLIADTDNVSVFGVARCGAGSECYRGANGESTPFDDCEFAHVDLTRAQIGRTLPQLR